MSPEKLTQKTWLVAGFFKFDRLKNENPLTEGVVDIKNVGQN
jgi:hypothetical protein